uniref:C2H2-type domain-containing protein n=1 Tax=Callorhinchus milii TaxID=7868 RepID=A0A4W3H8X9_CALMI
PQHRHHGLLFLIDSLFLCSDCIKIQPMDIQPDIFSYLLHLMYTGKGPKQPVDPSRLEEGIRFLHAYNLVHDPGHSAGFAAHHELLPLQSPNLYGIQISGSHKLSVSSPSAGGLRDLQPPALRNGSEPLRYSRGKSHKLYSCHYCGERFSTRSSLRDHLYSHSSGPPGESKPPLASEELEKAEGAELRSKAPEQGDGSIADETPHTIVTEPETPDTGAHFSLARKRKFSCLMCGRESLHSAVNVRRLGGGGGRRGGEGSGGGGGTTPKTSRTRPRCLTGRPPCATRRRRCRSTQSPSSTWPPFRPS